MNTERVWKHLKLFLWDHLWVILLFLAASVALPIFYLIVVERAVKAAWLYYSFLSLFLLLCFLLYRLYATWNLYELFCNEKAEMGDFLLCAPKSNAERSYQKLMLEFYRLCLAKLSGMEDRRKQNKLMIYRWVHQLKAPLSVIQLIAQKNRLEPGYKKVAQAATQIQYNLDQVLNMYKLDAIQNDFHTQSIPLRQIAKDSINELKSSFIERGIFPKLDVEEHLTVYSDPKWLRFVLHQLLTNALKYSDTGKTIAVRANRTESSTMLSVEDEGCGIQPEDLPRIFDLFLQDRTCACAESPPGWGCIWSSRSWNIWGTRYRWSPWWSREVNFKFALNKGTLVKDARKIAEL